MLKQFDDKRVLIYAVTVVLLACTTVVYAAIPSGTISDQGLTLPHLNFTVGLHQGTELRVGAGGEGYFESLNTGFGDYELRAMNQDLETTDAVVFGSARISDLTSGRVVFAGASGELQDDADLSFSGDTLTATKITANGDINITPTASTARIILTAPLNTTDSYVEWKETGDSNVDYQLYHSGVGNKFALWNTDIDGSGGNGEIFYIADGTDDVVFNGVVKASELQLDTDNKLQFRDPAIYMQSDSDGDLLIVADDVIQIQPNGGLLVYDPNVSLLTIRSNADDSYLQLDSGDDGTSETSGLYFQDDSTDKWLIRKDTDNNLEFYDHINDQNVLEFDASAATVVATWSNVEHTGFTSSGLITSTVAAGSPVFSFTATSDVVTADPTTDAPSGWMEVTVGGQTRYVPYYTIDGS